MALAALGSVACVCSSGLVAFRWWLRHQASKLENAPLAEVARKVDELETKVLQLQLSRR